MYFFATMMPSFTIAAAQTSSVKGDIAANVQIHTDFVRIAAEHDVDVIVFPELSLTGYEPELAGDLILAPEDKRLHRLHELSRRLDLTIIAGAPVESGLEKPHIGALIFSPGQSFIYAKNHLHGGEEMFFSPGDQTCVLNIKGRQVGLAICADTNHPDHARDAADHGASIYAAGVLLNENAYASDTALLQTYASKHGMLVVMANYSKHTGGWTPAGKSAIWDEEGQQVTKADGTENALVLATRHAEGWRGRVIKHVSKPRKKTSAISDFILFAHPRSGSTIIAEILDLHPRLRVLIEPFAENFHTWERDNKNYLEQIVDAASLDTQLTEIFTEYNGIKVTSWPLSFELYQHMMMHTDRKVIFLRRENLLKTAVSSAISHQTNVWEKRNLPADVEGLYKNLQNIPIDKLIEYIESTQKGMDLYEKRLHTRPQNMVKMITYEALYDHPSDQETLMHGLFDFIGVEQIFTDKMKRLLDKGLSQMNTEDMYRHIPNHEEIETQLGNKAHGFLFGS
jgi:predicted amidohydrolase/LPS sulfotransferase NodH